MARSKHTARQGLLGKLPARGGKSKVNRGRTARPTRDRGGTSNPTPPVTYSNSSKSSRKQPASVPRVKKPHRWKPGSKWVTHYFNAMLIIFSACAEGNSSLPEIDRSPHQESAIRKTCPRDCAWTRTKHTGGRFSHTSKCIVGIARGFWGVPGSRVLTYIIIVI